MTRAEVEDALEVCNEAMERYDCKIASIPTDNAAKPVASKVSSELTGTALPSRDPSHSTDLLSKDLAEKGFVCNVLEDADAVTDFCKTDRIDSIKDEMVANGEVGYSMKAVSMSKTRMNLVHDYVDAAQKQQNFILTVQRNEKYRAYYDERKEGKQKELNLMFE